MKIDNLSDHGRSDTMTKRKLKTTVAPQRSGFWAHALVAVCACILTVAIVGSIVFLGYRVYRHQQLRGQVRAAIAALQNRTPEEVAERAAEVHAHPKTASMVLPEVLKNLQESKSEQQQCSAIGILRWFVNDRQVERALFRLRRDSREGVAATAVAALGDIRPPERAAGVLGQCLDDAPAREVVDAVVDEACAALLQLGEAGRQEMERKLGKLSAARRVWLVGYVAALGGGQRESWLTMLSQDGDAGVRAAAVRAKAELGCKKQSAMGKNIIR